MTTQEALPYEESHHLSYNKIGADTARVRILPSEQDPEVILIEGPCVRCKHECLYEEPVVAYRDVNFGPIRDRLIDRALRAAAATVRQREITIYCRCRELHPGSPGSMFSASGCGAYWTLTVTWGD